MHNQRKTRFDALEPWSRVAFAVAGGLFVIFAGLWGAYAFTEFSSRTLQDAIGPAGWAFAFVGLLGLYPRLADDAVWAARAGAVFAAVGSIGAAVTATGNVAVLVGAVSSMPGWFQAVQLPILVGIVPGFLTFGIASFRARGQSSVLAAVLLVPAVLFAINFVRVATLGSVTPLWAPFVLGTGQAAAFLGIGRILGASPSLADDRESAADLALE